MSTLHFQDFVRPPQVLHISRSYVRGAGTPQHDHDFPEVFWIEEGEGCHGINGATRQLSAGQVFLMRPADVHALSSTAPGGMVLTNVAFAEAHLQALRAAYPGETAVWREDTPEPPCFALPPPALARLSHQAETLVSRRRSTFELHRFLLNLLAALQQQQAGEVDFEALPDWLRRAALALRDPEAFRLGPQQLATLAGRSPEHVARVFRAATGRTPGQYVTALRMEHAARLLLMEELPIEEVAMACGYQSLGHFYRCFREAHGVSPKRYRDHHRALV